MECRMSKVEDISYMNSTMLEPEKSRNTLLYVEEVLQKNRSKKKKKVRRKKCFNIKCSFVSIKKPFTHPFQVLMNRKFYKIPPFMLLLPKRLAIHVKIIFLQFFFSCKYETSFLLQTRSMAQIMKQIIKGKLYIYIYIQMYMLWRELLICQPKRLMVLSILYTCLFPKNVSIHHFLFHLFG